MQLEEKEKSIIRYTKFIETIKYTYTIYINIYHIFTLYIYIYIANPHIHTLYIYITDQKVEKYELAEMNLNIKKQQDALETPASKSIRKKGEEHMFLLSNLKAQHPLAEHVQEAKIVKHLELSKQPIQAAQLDTLQRRLPYLKSIVSINLSFTKLSDQLGGPALLTTLLGKKSRIQVLHLNDNMLGLYSFKVICDFYQ